MLFPETAQTQPPFLKLGRRTSDPTFSASLSVRRRRCLHGCQAVSIHIHMLCRVTSTCCLDAKALSKFRILLERNVKSSGRLIPSSGNTRVPETLLSMSLREKTHAFCCNPLRLCSAQNLITHKHAHAETRNDRKYGQAVVLYKLCIYHVYIYIYVWCTYIYTYMKLYIYIHIV